MTKPNDKDTVMRVIALHRDLILAMNRRDGTGLKTILCRMLVPGTESIDTILSERFTDRRDQLALILTTFGGSAAESLADPRGMDVLLDALLTTLVD